MYNILYSFESTLIYLTCKFADCDLYCSSYPYTNASIRGCFYTLWSGWFSSKSLVNLEFTFELYIGISISLLHLRFSGWCNWESGSLITKHKERSYFCWSFANCHWITQVMLTFVLNFTVPFSRSMVFYCFNLIYHLQLFDEIWFQYLFFYFFFYVSFSY